MKCSKCKQIAITENPALCSKHFQMYFEENVKKTIKDFKLFSKKDKICVAASGGKDSVSLLYVLKKLGYNVEALALDEGIEGYRDGSLVFLKKFCKKHQIKLKIFSYKKEVGNTIDNLSKKYSPACTVCGTFRRHLLDKHSKGYDKLATGHNLDDEAQAVLMNLLKAQTSLFSRQGPITKKTEGFTQKVKPFYFLKEKEIMTYAFLNNLNVDFEECPYAPESFRAHVRDLLNEYESENYGSKLNILKKYLSLKQNDVKELDLNKCMDCGSPCSSRVCRACRFKEEIKNV
jgi:uncharacterized protein (TIGR00269 family)